MKSLCGIPLLIVLAACGGGGDGATESAKPTIVDCMTPKAGVKFETDASVVPGAIDIQPGAYGNKRFEVAAREFEGQAALSIRTYTAVTEIPATAPRWHFDYARTVVATAAEFLLLGAEGPDGDKPDGIQIRYSPPVRMPATLPIGLPTVRSYRGTLTRVSPTPGGADEVTPFDRQDTIEWMGYDEITVAGGRRLSNVCKVKVSNTAGAFDYEWYAAGYGMVAREVFDANARLVVRDLIARVEQAP